MSFKRPCLSGLFCLVTWLVPAAAFAQSTIAGVVTDDSGGVLPGVTVEVASPALIEKTRTVVSDGQGRYTPNETTYYTGQTKWMSVISSRLMFDAAYAVTDYTRTQDYARTAIKGSWGKYIETWGTGFAQQYNSVALRSETRTWGDLNRDDIAQDNEIGPAADSNFGRVVALTRSPDPNITRAYSLSSSLGVEHQLLPALGVTFMWYDRDWKDLIRSDNDLVTLADYTPVDIASPLDGTVITVYNLNAAKRGQVQQIDRNSTLTDATLVVPLVPPGEQFTDRFVQVGVQLQKIFRFGEKRLTTGVQVFNLMNTSAVLQQNQTYGPSLGRPEITPEPRVVQASVRIDF